MAKKIRYSQPLAVVWDAYQESVRKSKKEVSPRRYIREWIRANIKRNYLDIEDSMDVQTQLLISDMFFADTEKKFLHLFFVDKSLRDFLMDLPLSDFNGLANYIIESGEEIEDALLSSLGNVLKTGRKSTNISFGIHIPFENKYRGYAFSFLYKAQEDKLIFSWFVNQDCGFITKEDFSSLEKQTDERSKTIMSYLRLAVNTIAYMNTFPGCIKDGVPEEVKEEYSKSIGIAEKVVEISEAKKSGKVVVPHFRRGYFKRLTSDFYTKKKGQVIFVSKTMVKGTAKTVYTADNLEEMVD
ncbi:MAG: hypothetical protein MJZ50_05415 [Treponema sp.]|nr:hypothetical protein [Treponema sp.]